MGKKGFQKGHPKFAPKLRTMRVRQFASTVRETISTQILTWFNVAIMMGKDAKVTDDESETEHTGMWCDECDLGITWPEQGGLVPSATERMAAHKALSDRGHGQAPQMVQLEATMRAELGTSGESVFGALPAAALLSIRETLQKALAPAPSD